MTTATVTPAVAGSPTLPAFRGADAATILTAYIVLLWAIPSPMTLGPLGSAGAPSNLLAIGTFFLWLWFHLVRNESTSFGFQPVRGAMIAWLLIILMVYAHAMAFPIPSDEISVADSGVLRLIGMTGVLVLANDGITTLGRHRALVRRLVIAAGIVALLGLVQFGTQTLYVDRLRIPGLTAGTEDWSIGGRGSFTRPSGTSTSPIEYGVVLGMMLPLAIAFARHSPRHRLLYRVLMLAVSFAIALSLSRSAYLSAGVGLVVASVSWSTAVRVRALGVLVALLGVIYVTVPSLLGTVLGLFSNAGNDPSIGSRTGSYDIAGDFIANSPILGRGFGTFLPKYWILDNGYLGHLIEAGALGLLALLAVIGAGAMAARRARLQAADGFDRDLAQALLASIAAGASGLAFFDSFAFPQTAGCFFLLIGLAGAFRRLTDPRVTNPGVTERTTT